MGKVIYNVNILYKKTNTKKKELSYISSKYVAVTGEMGLMADEQADQGLHCSPFSQ
ncbi:MAG: hypothetical protein ABW185_29525 [Sedimenticola sp.]